MADLFVGNIDPGIADEEIKGFLLKYWFPPFDGIKYVASDGPRPAWCWRLRAPMRSCRVAAAARARHVLERSKDYRSGHEGSL